MAVNTEEGRPLRTIFVTNDFPPRIGGAQTYYWGAIRTLDPSEVVIVAPAHHDAAAFDATHPYPVVRTPSSVLWPTPQLRRTVEHLVVTHDASLVQLGHPLPAGILGPQVKASTGVPYVVFLGAAEVTVPGAVPGVRRLLRHVLGNAARFFTISEYTARVASLKAGGHVPAEVLRSQLAVDEFVPAAPEEAAALRRGFGIDGELITCVGRLVPRKGQDRLIDALALLRREFPDVHLAIIGEGRLATRLHKLAQRRAVNDRIHFTGSLTDAKMRQWLRASDLFASPCRRRWGGLEVEGYGIVFAEAALCGLPVVAGRSGGSPEAVGEGETGLVVNGESPAEVATAIRHMLLLSPEERRAMGIRGRELALSRHTPAIVGARYRELLKLAAAR